MNKKELNKPLKAAGIFTVLSFLPHAIGVIMLPVYLKFMDTEEYGSLALLGLFGGFYAMFSCLQLNSAASINYFDYHKLVQRKKYISTIFSAVSLFSLISYFLFIGLGVLFFYFFLKDSNLSFFREGIIVLTTSLLGQICNIHFLFLKNEYRIKEFAWYSITYLLFNLLFQYYFIVVLSYGVFGSVLGSLLARSIVALILIVKQRELFTLHMDYDMLSKSLNFALPLIPVIFINWFLTIGDRFFLQQLMNLSAVGKYALLINLLVLSNLAFTSLWNALTPRLLEYFNDLTVNNYKMSKKLVSWHLKISMIVLAGTIMIGSNLNIITENEKYISIMPLFGLGALVMVPRVFKIVSNLQLMHLKKTKLISLNSLGSLVVLILGFLLLIPSYGLWGALCSLGLSNTFSFVHLFYLSRKHAEIVLFERTSLYYIVYSALIVFTCYIFVDWMQLSLGVYGFLSFLMVTFYIAIISHRDIFNYIKTNF